KCAAPVGVGIRVLQRGAMGFSFSTSMADSDLVRMIDHALVGAESQTPDECHLLPAPQPCPALPGLYDPELAAVAEELKIERAMDLERLVLAADERVRRVRKSSYHETLYEVQLRNSRGVNGGYRGTSVSCSVAAVAEADGDSQMGWDFDFSTRFAGIRIAQVAKRAAARATGMLGARPVATMRCPVVLDNHVASEFLELLASSFVAESIFKGKSILAGKQGESLFSPLLTIRDDGALPGGMATAPFDGEGVPHRPVVLVQQGVVAGFLYDTFYGCKLGSASTGHSVRAGVKGLPHCGVTNFFIDNGTTAVDELTVGISRGLLLTDVIGMHTANPISGDFSVGAAGFLIENGQLTVPVKGIAIAGNILDLFRNVEQVGDDLRFYSAIGAPSLRIASLDISGE
ncbi:MAG TPA: TldD/PmbA family protein, partial [Geobacteraceae bacterium]